MARENPLSQFKFNELSAMISTIFATKKRSSYMRATEGHGLDAIDDLEAKADPILDELTKRVSRQWSMQRIQYNFAASTEMLPIDLMNLFSISPYDLNRKIIAHPPKMGAEEVDGEDEIWVVVGNQSYHMSQKGIITIRPIKRY